jgi:hypothetical protein
MAAPRVHVAEFGRVWADARGMHGAALADELLRICGQWGLGDARAGAASTWIAAQIAATQSTVPGIAVVIPPGEDRRYIASFPIAALEPPPNIALLLAGLGIEQCGALAELDAESIEVRLGIEGVRLWERARCEERRWLFRAPVRDLPSASLEWVEYGLKDPERLLFVVNALAGTLCNALVSRGERAREVSLVFSLGNRSQRTHLLRSSRPSAEQKRWVRLAREALDTITLPDAVTGVALRVESVTGNDGAQGDLFDRGFASAPAVEDALTQLTDDQGDVVVRPRNSEHPLIEARTTWQADERPPRTIVVGGRNGIQAVTGDPSVAALLRDDEPRGALLRDDEPRRALLRDDEPRGALLRDDKHAAARAGDDMNIPQLRLQLLPTPRVVTVATEERRDHQIPTRYMDQNEWHELVDVAGPDRVCGGEWKAPYARDYFRCVRDDGTMVWLFRGESQGSDWFLQGWWD